MKIFAVLKFIWHVPRNIVCLLISGYQKTFSYDHGPNKHLFPFGYCRFKPSCSQYSYESIKKHGLVWGGIKSLWRIIRCNPWSKGGYDEV